MKKVNKIERIYYKDVMGQLIGVGVRIIKKRTGFPTIRE